MARVPATVLVPLPSQQSEIQRVKAENTMLTTLLQSARAKEKHYYESWIGTFPQFKSLKGEIEVLKKTLEETRQVEEALEDGNEFLTIKLGIRRNRVLPKDTFGEPAVTAESSIRAIPVKHTIMSKFTTPAKTKMINSYSLEDYGCISHASTSDRTFSAKKAYSASPTPRPRVSSSDSLIQVENGHKDFDLAAPDLSFTPFSAITTKPEVAKSPSNAALNLNNLSPYSCNVKPTRASAAIESTSKRDLMKMGPLKVSPPSTGGLMEKVLKTFLGVVVIFCLVGNLSFGQFTGLVVCASVVVWSQAERRDWQEILQSYYSLEDVADEYEAVLATKSKVTRDDKLRLTRRDEKLRGYTTSHDEEIEVQCTKSTSRYDDEHLIGSTSSGWGRRAWLAEEDINELKDGHDLTPNGDNEGLIIEAELGATTQMYIGDYTVGGAGSDADAVLAMFSGESCHGERVGERRIGEKLDGKKYGPGSYLSSKTSSRPEPGAEKKSTGTRPKEYGF